MQGSGTRAEYVVYLSNEKADPFSRRARQGEKRGELDRQLYGRCLRHPFLFLFFSTHRSVRHDSKRKSHRGRLDPTLYFTTFLQTAPKRPVGLKLGNVNA